LRVVRGSLGLSLDLTCCSTMRLSPILMKGMATCMPGEKEDSVAIHHVGGPVPPLIRRPRRSAGRRTRDRVIIGYDAPAASGNGSRRRSADLPGNGPVRSTDSECGTLVWSHLGHPCPLRCWYRHLRPAGAESRRGALRRIGGISAEFF
jgi:hypothetical protein